MACGCRLLFRPTLGLVTGIGKIRFKVKKVIRRGDKVFLKPNLVDAASFATGEVVQLEFMETLIRESFYAGAFDVIIGETPTYRND